MRKLVHIGLFVAGLCSVSLAAAWYQERLEPVAVDAPSAESAAMDPVAELDTEPVYGGSVGENSATPPTYVPRSTAAPPASANFVMNRTALASGGGTADSGSFETTVIIAETAPAGSASSCNNGFRSSFGVWSALGDLPVPIELRLNKAPDGTNALDLTWSGAEPSFEVYRAFSPETVVAPGNLTAVTPLCDLADDQTSADVLFYIVIAAEGESSNSLKQAKGGRGQ